MFDFVLFLFRFIVSFVLSAIKTNNVWVLYLLMTGLSLPLQLWSQNLLVIVLVILLRPVPESIYASPKSLTPKAFHKHYKQTNDKLKTENISLKYIIKR